VNITVIFSNSGFCQFINKLLDKFKIVSRKK
jgi:hypothetical protein